jgi:hypothetical protein
MFEEIVPAIASALSTHGSELAAAGGKAAIKSLYELIRARFGRGTHEAGSLDAAIRQPGDAARVAELAASLAAVMARDPEFARQVPALWQTVTVSGSAVVNNFSGQAGQVIQARTIRGGIRF